ELEEHLLGLNHAQVGAELLRNWRLPDEITEPVRWHHDWAATERLRTDLRDRARLLVFASKIGQLQATAEPQGASLRELLALAAQDFQMKEPEVRVLLEALQFQMAEFAATLQVDIGDCVEYGEVMNRGIEELTRLNVLATVAAASGAPVLENTDRLL